MREHSTKKRDLIIGVFNPDGRKVTRFKNVLINEVDYVFLSLCTKYAFYDMINISCLLLGNSD